MQIVIAVVALLVSGVVTLLIALALKATMGWRIPEDAEVSGIDTAEHAETSYDLVARGGRLGVTGSGPIHDARHHSESLSPASSEGAK